MARPSATLLVALALAGLASAAEPTPAPARTPEELDRLNEEIARTEAQRAADEAERASLTADLESLQAEAAASAAEVQKLERALSRAEARIGDLAGRDAELSGALEQRRDRIGPLLGALQRLRRDPPPALAVSPDDAIGAARGAMLIASIAERLEGEARALAADLEALGRNRAALVAERDTARARAVEIADRRVELAALIARRQAAVAQLNEGVAGAEADIAALRARAADMTELMAWLEEDSAAVPAPAAEAARKPVTVARRGAKTSFAARKGEVLWPAAGIVAGRFGEPGPGGGAALGLTIRTRAEAQVTAPADGEIVFAGPFEGYGRLLILAPGEGYFVLIGGFGRLDAVQGQHVLAGEPLGTMAGTGAAGEALMYLELRRDGAPIDPLPWLAPDEANG